MEPIIKSSNGGNSTIKPSSTDRKTTSTTKATGISVVVAAASAQSSLPSRTDQSSSSMLSSTKKRPSISPSVLHQDYISISLREWMKVNGESIDDEPNECDSVPVVLESANSFEH
ncbi:unnamed protein product [Trichobilharzia regenti]|nr:unnamed protein product [Trichobilharzia regenti]